MVTRGGVKVLLLVSDDFREQMREVAEVLNLGFDERFSLCIECNVPLEEIAIGQVRDRVPPFVFKTQKSFQVYPRCNKLYWRGTHWRNMEAEMARFKRAK